MGTNKATVWSGDVCWAKGIGWRCVAAGELERSDLVECVGGRVLDPGVYRKGEAVTELEEGKRGEEAATGLGFIDGSEHGRGETSTELFTHPARDKVSTASGANVSNLRE